MRASTECKPCFVRQATEAVGLSTNDPALEREILHRVLDAMVEEDWCESPPAIAQRLHRIIRKLTNDTDPYRTVKDRMNTLALEALPLCKQYIEGAKDPHEAVVRIAVAGNLLDSGSKLQVQPDNLSRLLEDMGNTPLVGDPHELFRAAERAERIIYLADNAGEIIFDRLLVEALPTGRLTVAVRGRPILNDALREDAERAGITNLVRVIENGSDAPGTVLDDCSEEFRQALRQADLIVSKGQGNYEGLSEVRAPIFFLFTVKCQLVARQVEASVGTMVAKKSSAWAERMQT